MRQMGREAKISSWQEDPPEFEEVSRNVILRRALRPPVLLVVVKKVERLAILRLMKPYAEKLVKGYVDKKTYYVGMFGAHRAVLTTCKPGSIGRDAAITSIMRAIHDLDPSCVIMVGIAFGKDPAKQHIGQVLVASKIISYEQQRRGEDQEFRGSISDVDAALLDRFSVRDDWDFTLQDKSQCRCEVGQILSGEKLIDDLEYKEQLFSKFSQAIGGEMEGVGLSTAASSHGVPWILVKSISDWADGNKRNENRLRDQALAAATAASLVYAVLSRVHALEGISQRNSTEEVATRQLLPGRYVFEVAPQFQDEETRILSTKLDHAYERKKILAAEGIRSPEIIEEIRALKRQLRAGGQLRAGDVLGEHYRLLNQLGRGRFATVWHAQDMENRERVAVKVLHSQYASDGITKDRFYRGARHMRAVDHPGVVRVVREREEDDRYCFCVMELIEGGTLEDAIGNSAIDKKDVLPTILKIGQALEIFHDKGLVHRDIKPSNILITKKREPKLTDFDLILDHDSTGGTTGGMGTYLYAAPEALNSAADVDPSADVYGLALTAVYMYRREHVPFLRFEKKDDIIGKLDCPSQVKVVLRQALSTDPFARFRNAAAFCTALREARNLWIRYLIKKYIRWIAIVLGVGVLVIFLAGLVVYVVSMSGLPGTNSSSATARQEFQDAAIDGIVPDGGAITVSEVVDADVAGKGADQIELNSVVNSDDKDADASKFEQIRFPRGVGGFSHPSIEEICMPPRVDASSRRTVRLLIRNREEELLEGEVTVRASSRNYGENVCLSDSEWRLAPEGCERFLRIPFSLVRHEFHAIEFVVSARDDSLCTQLWNAEVKVSAGWELRYRIIYEVYSFFPCSYRYTNSIAEFKTAE